MTSTTAIRPPCSIPVRAERWPAPLLAALRRPGFHPGCSEVQVRETHTAWVVLAGDRALKLKKPVRLGFVDFTDLDARRAALEAELEVNRALAPDVYVGLRSVQRMGGSFLLRDGVWPEAVEFVLEMRRFDESRTLEALLGDGTATAPQLRRVAERLHAFHRDAAVIDEPDLPGRLRRRIADDVADLLARAEPGQRVAILDLERFCDAFLVAHDAELRARAAAGLVRDVHGDLRAGHVVLPLDAPLAIVDRLEFDPQLRRIDVGEDLAFLLMDLERLGQPRTARHLLRAYRLLGGDPGSDALLGFYAVHRALVRVKVALIEAGQRDGEAADRSRGTAERLLDLAERLAWSARSPLVLAVSGPPASGKSTLGEAIRDRSGWIHRSTDRARAAAADRYSPEARAGVYRTLGLRARDDVDRGAGVVVDGTFGSAALRAAFLEGLGPAATRLRVIDCTVPETTRARWAAARTAGTAHGSEADAATAARLAEKHCPWDELPGESVLELRTDVPDDLPVREVAAWLDLVSATSTRIGG